MAKRQFIHTKAIRERYIRCCQYLVDHGIDGNYDLKTLAANIGVHPIQLTQMEKIVRRDEESNIGATTDMIVELCQRYDFSIEWVMTGEGLMRLSETQLSKLKRYEKTMKKLETIVNSLNT